MTVNYAKKSFLVIDDFEKFRNVVKGIIQMCGAHNIDLAVSASDALYRIKTHTYDVILCDYHLGEGKNGQQILEQLRHEKLLKPSTVFLMISAESSSEMVIGAIECQPDGYLMKPFNQAILKNRLNKILAVKARLKPIYDALDEDDRKKAIKMCQTICKEHPKFIVQCKQIEAELYIEEEEYGKAKQMYEKILGVRNLPWASLGLGKVLYLMEDYKGCIGHLSALIEENKLILQAYDWIARSYMHLDKVTQAEETLKTALEISPQAILRQMELGNIAYDHGDMEMAEDAYRAAMKIGKNSCHKSPENYTRLVRTLMPKLESDNETVRKQATDETFNAIKEVKHDYREDKNLSLEATLLESQSYTKLHNDSLAQKAMDKANALLETYEDELDPQLKVDMAKTLIDMGHKEKGEAMAQKLMSEYKDNKEISSAVGDFIESTPLNSEGMDFYRAGNYIEAIHKFEEACKEYPTSISINLNAIQALVMCMQENKPDEVYLELCEQHFKRLSSLKDGDSRHKRFLELRKMYQELLPQTGSES